MTLTVSEVRGRLEPHFPDLKQVDEHIVCFSKSAGERVYAVCYVDVKGVLPDSMAALNAYQDRVVASRYFDGSKSLQWNNYLYFIVDEQQPTNGTFREAKELIERDRKYARKFIITEPELETAVRPLSFAYPSKQVGPNILTTWTNILGEANLDQAILNDESVPKRIDLIETSFGQKPETPPHARSVRHAMQPPFLATLELIRFRPFPTEQVFELGTVNLVCGANGTGKTSLLEAIELLYCGRTKRNPGSKEKYSIRATYANNKSDTATHHRSTSMFREQNLLWYGQDEIKTNNLYQSFSRFNFLNTDAAVSLAESNDSIEEDLSKLLVGPAASKTWGYIAKTKEGLDKKIRDLEKTKNEAEVEFAAVSRRLDAASKNTPQADSMFQGLVKIARQAKWPMQEGDKQAVVAELAGALVEFASLVEQAMECTWVESPVTLSSLKLFVATHEKTCSVADSQLNKLREAQRKAKSLSAKLTPISEQYSRVAAMEKLVKDGVPQKLEDIEQTTTSLAASRSKLSGFDDSQLRSALQSVMGEPCQQLLTSASKIVSEAETAHRQAKEAHSAFLSLRDKSIGLAQQLRDIAAQLLEDADNSDACPLCHTEFEPGELQQHIHAGVDTKLEEQATKLTQEVRSCNEQLVKAKKVESAVNWIRGFCEKGRLSLSTTVESVLQTVSETQQSVKELESRIAELREEISAVSEAESTVAQYKELLLHIQSDLGHKGIPTVAALTDRLGQLDSEQAEIASNLRLLRAEIDEMQESLRGLLANTNSGDESFASILGSLRERVERTRTLLTRLAEYDSKFPWPPERPISQLSVVMFSLREATTGYHEAVARERQAASERTEDTKRAEQIQKLVDGLVPRIERLRGAQDVLESIQVEHSLTGAMEDVLQANRSTIEAVFTRIHSPAEFSGLGDSLTTLVRKRDQSEASLSQISTGQRSAFALSLFLAQNAQLQVAPPIVLVDDPIAHVDDLNSLSFLDYLRDLVVAGRRQVFFATANERLATLFERKFDFLGEQEFRRFDLRR